MSLVRTTTVRLAGALALLAAPVLGAAVVTAPPANAAPTWAPAATAAITPGVQMYTAGAQCTANFVFTDSSDNVYVGYAAHCAGLGEATDTNGCLNDSVPLGTAVTFNKGGSLVDEGTQVGPARSSTPPGSPSTRSAPPTPTPVPTTTWRWSRSRTPTRARSTRRSRSGAARPASTPTAPPRASACGASATRASAPGSPSCRPRPASASATTPPTVAGRTRSTP